MLVDGVSLLLISESGLTVCNYLHHAWFSFSFGVLVSEGHCSRVCQMGYYLVLIYLNF